MKFIVHALIALLLMPMHAWSAPYTPKAEKVVDNIYAIVGPLNQRSPENDGLNNNLGFIVTDEGVILIDSGASLIGAKRVASAISEITTQPVRWVINTGSQDHRWLGNDYFASQGAELIAMERTIATQKEFTGQHMDRLQNFLGDRLEGTKPMPATQALLGDKANIELGGVELAIQYTDAHFPGDTMIWVPASKVIFTGDLVYVDRVFSVHPWSSMKNAQQAYAEMEALNPVLIVPGHGAVSNLAKARNDCGNYIDFLNDTIGAAAEEMEPMDEVLNQFSTLAEFEHLENFTALHRTNMNRTFLEYEAF